MALSTFQKSQVDFVLISLAGDGTELSDRVSRIFAMVEQHGGSVRLIASAVMVTYGAQSDSPRAPERFHSLIDDLKQFGPHIKAVYGSEPGHAGFLTGQHAFGFHVMLPHLTEARLALLSLSWGEITEFNK